MLNTLDFLKLMADATRLNILGLLAQSPRSGDELATILKLKPSTVSYHVTRLQEAGLVGVRAQQYYKIYALNPAVLHQYASLLTAENLAERTQQEETVDTEAYTMQIMARWLKDGLLQGIPRKVQHKRTIFAWVTSKFEQNQRYDEDQIWELLEQCCHPHYITELIRGLVGDNYLQRLRNNQAYWRTDSPLAQRVNFDPKLMPLAQWPDPLKYTATRATLQKRDPHGDYANLKEKIHVPDLDRERKLLVFRLKICKRFTVTEVEAHIEQYRQNLPGTPADIRVDLVQRQLLKQDADGRYWREEITWQTETTRPD